LIHFPFVFAGVDFYESSFINPYPHPGVAGAISDKDADNPLGRLVKYIPAEVISGYMVLSGLLELAPPGSPLRLPAAWVLVILGTILTPAYLSRIDRDAPEPVGKLRRWQYPISTVSFLFWAYALGGVFRMGEPLAGKYPYEPWLATLSAGAFSWAVALVWKPTLPKNTVVPSNDGIRQIEQPPKSLDIGK
jgi:hypothetical protein